MPLEVSADLDATQYATVDDIDEAAETHIAGAAWLALEDEQKEAAAATANAEIDALEASPGFIGERTDDDQPLAWPRTGTEYSSDAWPTYLIRAVIERAIELASSGAASAGTNVVSPSTSSTNIKRKKAGSVEIEYFAATTTETTDPTAVTAFGAIVQRYLTPLLLLPAVAGWGSATVVRSS